MRIIYSSTKKKNILTRKTYSSTKGRYLSTRSWYFVRENYFLEQEKIIVIHNLLFLVCNMFCSVQVEFVNELYRLFIAILNIELMYKIHT